MNAYLGITMDGKASWTINGDQENWQGTKPESVKSRIVLDQRFALV